MIGSVYNQNDILETAMRAASVRNDVISDNIANADTPHYKAKTVSFEASLQSALGKYARTGVLDLTDAKPTIDRGYADFHYRLDQNNVDVESEMAALYRNSVRYDALTSGVIANNRRINLVLTGR